MPCTFEIATGDVRISAVLVTVETATKCADSIERIQLAEPGPEQAAYDSDDGKPDYYNSF